MINTRSSLLLTHWRPTAVNTAHPPWTGHLNGPLTLQLRSTVQVPLHEHNFSQYKHI